MTSPPPWGPDPATGPLAIKPAPRRRRYAITGLAVVALMAATAAATYVVTVRTVTTPAADAEDSVIGAEQAQASTTTALPNPAAASAAEESLCSAFDLTTRGNTGRGGVVTDGASNMPNIVRNIGSAITVQRAITPEVPSGLADTANTYVDRTLELSNAALANEPFDDTVRRTHVANAATKAFAEACGLTY